MLQHVKTQYQGEAEYRDALAQDHVTEAEVTAHLLAGLRALRFTDLRFRPEVQTSEDELREYYKTLVEKWRGQNSRRRADFRSQPRPGGKTPH